MAKSKLKRSNKIFAVVSSVILGLFSLIYIGLLFWALISSVKSLLDFGYNPFGFPKTGKAYGWHFENYYIAYRIMNVQIVTATEIIYVKAAGMFLNSILYATGCAVFAVFWTSLVAYCCAKYDYKICKIIYAMVVVVIILPVVGALPSEVQMSKALGLYDSIPGLWIMRSGFQNVNFLVFYGVFKAVPKTYSEAAAIDGAGQWTVYFRIIFPLVKATLFAVALLQFITFWNDYSIPMMYLPSHPVIAYGLYKFQNSRSSHATEPVKLAASMIVCLPVLILFLAFRDKIMTNVSFGGLKG